MLDDAQAAARGVDQHFAHDAVFEDGVAVVGHGDCAGSFERRVVVENFAFERARRGADGEDPYRGAAFGSLHPARDLRRIVGRHGVGHGGDRGESAGCCRSSPGGDGFLVALARLAQVHVDIDEAGGDGEPLCIEDLGVWSRLQFARRGDLADPAVFEQDVFGSVDAGGRVDQMPVANEEAAHARTSLSGRVSAR